MFLQRIQVPNFRALKDVDLTFEPEFSPRIFPLGSLNGGGKSTLLQLIFILLSCSGDPKKHFLIKNILEDFDLEKNEDQRILATIYLLDKNQEIKLQFICQKEGMPEKELRKELGEMPVASSMHDMNEKLKQEIAELKDEIKILRKQSTKFKELQENKYLKNRNIAFEQEFDNIIYGKSSIIRNLLKTKIESLDINLNLSNLNLIQEIITDKVEKNQQTLKVKQLELDKVELIISRIPTYLENHNLVDICNYGHKNYDSKEYALLCKSEQLNKEEVEALLQRLINRIFLAAPFTQVFLFMPKKDSRLLFKDSNNKHNYHAKLKEIKDKLPNLFTYDLLSVDYIIDSFKEARDQDFKQAIESGDYGNSYKHLLNEFNSLLGNKKINLDTDLSGVNFKIETDEGTKELYPEDLSHGELKRLSIYVWLKYKQIEDSIVLMDEIENAFHPDWQYQIISDLAEWGASNQYVLATHSYELCQALTPSHVKELEPKLIPSEKTEN